MKISVVLCTYKGTKYLREQLDSIRAQRRPADEVLIFDDCSGDGTAQLCTEYIARYALSGWHVSVNPKNMGFIANFHQAIAASCGDWIALCDQDDVWAEDKLSRMAECVENHPDARAIAGDFDIIDQFGAPGDPALRREIVRGALLPEGPGAHLLPPFGECPELLLIKNFAPGFSLMISREVKEAYLAGTRRNIFHDWELVLIAQMMGGLYYLGGVTAHYRIHGSNTVGVSLKKRSLLPSYAGREKTMRCYEGVLEVAEGYSRAILNRPVDDRYPRFMEARRHALERGNFADYLRVLRFSDVYGRMFTFSQRLGDLLLVLAGGGKARERGLRLLQKTGSGRSGACRFFGAPALRVRSQGR